MLQVFALLSLLSLLGLGSYLLGLAVFRAAALPFVDLRSVTVVVHLMAAVMAFAFWIGAALASVAGVVAAIVSVQHGSAGGRSR